jgi:acyl-CoA thioesterase FadM
VQEQPAFIHRIRVGWADCDPALIAYTGRIPCFALEAIDAWWEHHVGADWYRLNLDQNIGTPFVHLDVDFRAPVTPRAPLECHVHLKTLGTSSVTFQVEGRQNGVVCFGGTFVSAFVEAKSFRKVPVPEHIRAEIEPVFSSS